MVLNKNMLNITVSMGIISWIATLGAGYLFRFSTLHNSQSDFYLFLTKAFLVAFILFIYFFYKQKIGRKEGFNIIDLLWKVFVTGLIATVASLSSNFLLSLLRENEHGRNPYFLDTLYLINIGLIITFLVSTFSVWKRLILYQKSKWLVRTWNVFEYGLLASSIFYFTSIEFFEYMGLGILGILSLLGVVLSVNLKWVAYLNFKQKWKSILLIILIALYIIFFYESPGDPRDNNEFINAQDIITVNALYIFTITYCLFSVLVILFNLPTSSVFEQKLVEVINFQKLSQSRNTGQDEDQVYVILLESSVSVVLANAAWLDIMDEEERYVRTLYFKTNKIEKGDIISGVRSNKIKAIQSTVPSRNKIQDRYLAEVKHEFYKSILVIPVFIQDKQIAILSMVKDVNDGFTKEMVEIVRTFINQASISIENYRLMEQAIKNERYKEELKIAKRVQDSLLPKVLHTNADLEISGFSKAAAEVGGDYFDTYKLDQDRLAIIVGDVSGKGTSAAFHMSQMKGIFQSLVQLNLTAKDFIIKANNALSECLDRTSFITISYFIIDSKSKKFEFSRAGHCPTLYYSAKKQKVEFLEDNGLGLGILRDSQFDEFVDTTVMGYDSGDILFLYTDGITEAKSKINEEFGYERLKQFLENHVYYSAEFIKEEILKNLYEFCGSSNLDDDITTLIIKVK
jgi:serine phosphatase RsbU (regulator of sigma subunit)